MSVNAAEKGAHDDMSEASLASSWIETEDGGALSIDLCGICTAWEANVCQG